MKAQETLHVISLGAGVQSTTMALMAARGEIGPMPHCAIFADTGFEPKRVYEHLEWLKGELPFPVYTVSNGNLRDAVMTATEGRYAAVPFFLEGGGMGRRQCTHEYKLKPISWELRRILGKGRRERIAAGAVTVWLGISLDEVQRMKDASVKWQTNRFPLIEQKMTRWDCRLWLERRQYKVPPKSSCVICPYHTNAHWRDIRNNAPDDWELAVEADMVIRQGETIASKGIRQKQFVHRSLKPLTEVDLDSLEDKGQISFLDECDGICGT